jgi:hypothetical protein
VQVPGRLAFRQSRALAATADEAIATTGYEEPASLALTRAGWLSESTDTAADCAARETRGEQQRD